VVGYFWAYAKSLDEEGKKKLLSFITSSDRVPVGGCKNLRIVISKHGTDPTRCVPSCASQSPINTRAPVSPVDFECVHLSSLRAAAGAGAGAAPGYPRHTHASTTCFYRSTNRWSN